MSPRRIPVVLALVFVLVAPTPGRALFHLAHVHEVMSGANGDATVQYVEIRMLTGLQNFVLNTRLTAFNCDGSAFDVLLVVPGNVTNAAPDVRWIMATPSFAAAAGITPDFTWDPMMTGSIPASCGMVCWGAPGISAPMPGTWDPADPNQYVDCVAYGGYTGPRKTSIHDATPASGTPTSLLPGDGTMSLTRVSFTQNNANDFALACPTPQNNAGMTGTFPAPCTGTTTTTTTSAPTTTLPGPSKCTSKRLDAAGKKAGARAKCHSKAVAKGDASTLTACLAATETQFAAAYASAGGANDCRTTADAATIEGKVDAFVTDVADALVAGATAASKCTSKELAAAGKKTGAKAKCHAKAVAKNDPSGLPACLGAADTKFDAAYLKAMAVGGCLTVTDAATVEGKVDAFMADLKATLAP